MIIDLLEINPVFKLLNIAAERLGVRSYVVGGYVRDIFLERKSKDIDIVCVGSGIELAQSFAQLIDCKKICVYKNFGTAMVRYASGDELGEIEFVGARKESYNKKSRNPIVESGTLEDDLNRRDFTINTLALSLNTDDFGELLDVFYGLADLHKGIIKTPLNPDITYSDDPLRMLRAIRFATQLNFIIEEESFKSICHNADRIQIISMERVTDEFNKTLLSPVPSKGILLLDKSGLLQYVFPELLKLKGVEVVNGKGHKDVFYHTLKVLDNVAKKSDNLWLRWAALLHDIGKPETKSFSPEIGWSFHGHEVVGSRKAKKIFERFKLPMNEKLKYVQKLIYLHLRPQVLSDDMVTDSAIRRLLFNAGEDIDDLMLLCEADITSGIEQKVKKYLANFKIVRQKLIEIEEKDFLRTWQPPITGEHVMETFDIQPSPTVGIIKNAVRDAILDGECNNSFDDAFEYMLKKGLELGLKPKYVN
ncbi:MAG: HD domain-containing protein [Bacteroidales bacterium]|nr:HD domain-containing protein [Bacteroidales bacterium]MDD3913637.1 HD domain-containing protein [Bacteroidales bacterium]MDD4634718.1 HD domain-containing protein [Bacteroidales bacterium]